MLFLQVSEIAWGRGEEEQDTFGGKGLLFFTAYPSVPFKNFIRSSYYFYNKIRIDYHLRNKYWQTFTRLLNKYIDTPGNSAR